MICKLSDIITDIAAGPFGSNLKVECFVEDGFPIIDGANLDGFKVEDNITKFVTEQKARSLHRSIAKRGDVIVTISGNVGQIAYIPEDSKYEEYLCSQRQFRVTFDKSKVYVPWLVYFFHTRIGQHQILQFANQVGVPALSQPLKNFRNIQIDLPPISVQKKVAYILYSLDQKIEINEKENLSLSQIIGTHFKEFYLDKRKPDWKTYSTSELFDYIGGYSYTSAELTEDSTVGMMTIKNFERTGGFKTDGFKPINPKKAKVPIANKFDIFVSCTDVTQNADIIGNAVMLLDTDGYDKVTYSMDLVKIEPKINRFVLYAILSSKEFKNFALGYKSGTTVLHLNKKCLKEYIISLPENEQLEKFGRMVEKVCEKISSNLAENRNLRQIRNTLLPNLMSGKINLDKVTLNE